ncbi:MAG: hypothetical protein WA970_00775 [Gammaproteobacteria bacterium]
MAHTTKINRQKNKCRRKQRGNVDFAIAQSSAGDQQLYNDPADGREHNHRAEDSQGIERLSLVDRD